MDFDEVMLKIALDKLADDPEFMDDIETYYFLVEKGLARPIIDIEKKPQRLTFKPD